MGCSSVSLVHPPVAFACRFLHAFLVRTRKSSSCWIFAWQRGVWIRLGVVICPPGTFCFCFLNFSGSSAGHGCASLAVCSSATEFFLVHWPLHASVRRSHTGRAWLDHTAWLSRHALQLFGLHGGGYLRLGYLFYRLYSVGEESRVDPVMVYF